MNLKVPTFPPSIPIHVPMGGLLMISMTSPLCETGAGMLTFYFCFVLKYKLISKNFLFDHSLPSALGSRCHRDLEWSLCEPEHVHKRVHGKAAHLPLRPQTSRSPCCCWRSRWCPLSDRLHEPQNISHQDHKPWRVCYCLINIINVLLYLAVFYTDENDRPDQND